MEWLIVIAQMCQVSVSITSSAYNAENSVHLSRKCRLQLIECVGDSWNTYGKREKLRECLIKQAKGNLDKK